jgi:hypothetical protein
VSGYRPTLAVHVIWHPACEAAAGYARALFAHLFEDPDDLASHGLRIPVRLWRSTGAGGAGDPPPPDVPPLTDSERAMVVVLVDDEFAADPGWRASLDALAAARRDGDVIVPVALTAAALEIPSPLLDEQAIRLFAVEDEDLRESYLVNRVTHTLCRAVAGTDDPVEVFISHAKRDGVEIAELVRTYLHKGSGIGEFFDAQNLLEGTRWADQIREAAANSVLLAIRTDEYATREWCRIEVIEAKRAGAPVIVLDALQRLEQRGFPYLGNAPSVRWSEDSLEAMEHLLGVVLRETLRFRYFPARVKDLCCAYDLPDHDRVLARPPELLTVLHERGREGETPLVYPDPPLGTDELALVTEFAPDLRMITPTALIANR